MSKGGRERRAQTGQWRWDRRQALTGMPLRDVEMNGGQWYEEAKRTFICIWGDCNNSGTYFLVLEKTAFPCRCHQYAHLKFGRVITKAARERQQLRQKDRKKERKKGRETKKERKRKRKRKKKKEKEGRRKIEKDRERRRRTKKDKARHRQRKTKKDHERPRKTKKDQERPRRTKKDQERPRKKKKDQERDWERPINN